MYKKNLRKALSVVLSAAVAVTSFTIPAGNTVKASAAGNSRETEEIDVSSAEDLQSLETNIKNAFDSGKDVKVEIKKDIDLGSVRKWKPINISKSIEYKKGAPLLTGDLAHQSVQTNEEKNGGLKNYEGNFSYNNALTFESYDGNVKTISNLNSYLGLFSYLFVRDITIRNIKLENFTVDANADYDYFDSERQPAFGLFARRVDFSYFDRNNRNETKTREVPVLNIQNVSVDNSVIKGNGTSAGGFIGDIINHKVNIKGADIKNSSITSDSFTGGFANHIFYRNPSGYLDDYYSQSSNNDDKNKNHSDLVNKDDVTVTASNMKISGSTVTSVSGRNGAGLAGGLFGNIDVPGILTDVENEDSKVTGFINVGGIVGTSKADIINAHNSGTVNGTNLVGGITGVNNASVKGTENEGTVTGKTANVGGITGLNNGTIGVNEASGRITQNSGKVTAGENSDGIVAGGIAGENAKEGKIESAVNTGKISGKSQIGGIVGLNAGTVANSDAADSKGNKVGKTTNSGTVTGTGNKIGGIAGENSGTIESSDNTQEGKVTSTGDQVGGNVGDNTSTGIVNDPSNKAEVTGNNDVGGNIGLNEGKVTGSASNDGSVTGNTDVGGNSGYNKGTDSVLENLANTADVTGNENVGGNVGRNEGTVTGSENKGTVTGRDTNVGGNAGYNTATGEVKDPVNQGRIDAEDADNVGGNVGLNEGNITGSATNKEDVKGGSNVGGNTGYNKGDDSTLENPVNSGDVDGTKNVGGNVGLNEGTVKGTSENSGNINGNKDTTGANAGNNSSTGKIDDQKNNGGIVNGEDTEPNIGKNDGSAGKADNTAPDPDAGGLNLSDYEKDKDKGWKVVDPEDPDKYEFVINGMTIKASPSTWGAIFLKKYDKDSEKVSLTAVPVEGYKFNGWAAAETSPESSDKESETFDVKKGAVVTAAFGEVKKDNPDSDNPGTKDQDSKDNTSGDKGNNDNGNASGTSAASPSGVTSGSAAASRAGVSTSSAATLFAVGTTFNVGDYIYKVKRYVSTGSSLNTVAVTGVTNKNLKGVEAYNKITSNSAVFKVVAIGSKAFSGLKKATVAKIGKNVKTVGARAFAGDSNIKRVMISSKKITKIGNGAFKGLKKVKTINLKSKKLKSIGKNAFSGMKNLKNVRILSTRLKKVGKKAFFRGKKAKGKLKIYVPKNRFKKYKKLIKKSKSKKYVVKKIGKKAKKSKKAKKASSGKKTAAKKK